MKGRKDMAMYSLKFNRRIRNSLCLLLIVLAMTMMAVAMSSCKAWRTYSTTATYSVAPDKSGNPVTTIKTSTVEEYTGVKKN